MGADLRLTELVAAISLATDLGTGQPLEHALHTCLLSGAVARELGLDDAAAADVHYVALLRFLGCTADTPETAHVAGGDNLAFYTALAPLLMGPTPTLLGAVVRHAGAGRPLPRRARLVAQALNDPGGRSLIGHCEVGARLATRLGLGAGVVEALDHAYERWDGGGPRGVRGTEVPLAVRVVVVARDAVLWERLAGHDAALDVLGRRRGHAYDPAVVDAARALDPAQDTNVPAWERVLAAEPEPVRRIGPVALDRALAAVGDFADLRSTWTRGRSRQVAADPADGLGLGGQHPLPRRNVRVLRRV
ncbi:MAG: HD domain-containing phosphohydrolase, partial [Pseudonocardia sp.]